MDWHATSDPVAALWGVLGADPRRTLLAVLVQGEITAGDIDAAVMAHETARRLLAMMPGTGGDDMAATRFVLILGLW
jgi:DNA-binding transcriptional ArsR family regulator